MSWKCCGGGAGRAGKQEVFVPGRQDDAHLVTMSRLQMQG